MRECEHEHVPWKGVFMEELMAEEVGQKRMSESEFGSLPKIAPFQGEEIDRLIESFCRI